MFFENKAVAIIGGVAALIAGAYVLWGPDKAKRRSRRKGTCPGLVNSGNTCFLNALLQALAPCSSVTQWLTDFVNKQKETYGQYLASTLLQVVKVLNNDSFEHEEEYEAGGVISALQARRWVISSEEQDAHELFHVLTETLNEETQCFPSAPSLQDIKQIQEEKLYQTQNDARNRANTLLPVLPSRDNDHPFRGQLASQLQCKKCSFKYPVKHDTFDSLSLTFPNKFIPGIVSLEQLLHHFISSETIDDVFCDGCTKKQPRVGQDGPKCTAPFFKKMTIGKRALWLDNGLPSKRTEFVQFPEFLNMSDFIYTKKPKKILRPNSLDLDLGAGLKGGKHIMTPQKQTPTPSPILSPPYSGPINMLKALNWHAKSSLTVGNNISVPQQDSAQVQQLVQAYRIEAPPSMQLPGNMYRLVAVVVHLGDMNSGHFVTYRRAPSSIGQRFPDRWLYTSDTLVRKASTDEVMSASAYMLFYDKF